MGKSILENVSELRSRIGMAAEKAGRDPGAVTLLGATKNRGAGEILEAAGAGVRVVGENRVQELLDKVREVGDAVDWHFIGHLQRNKAKYLVEVVSLVHSVDSVALATELDRRAGISGVKLRVLLQVNVAAEQSKSGFEPGEVADVFAGTAGLENLEVCGLSTIAPMVRDPEQVRWVFRSLRELAVGFRFKAPCVLSMGMTNDFEVAVEEGATIVRLGSAIFDRV